MADNVRTFGCEQHVILQPNCSTVYFCALQCCGIDYAVYKTKNCELKSSQHTLRPCQVTTCPLPDTQIQSLSIRLFLDVPTEIWNSFSHMLVVPVKGWARTATAAQRNLTRSDTVRPSASTNWLFNSWSNKIQREVPFCASIPGVETRTVWSAGSQVQVASLLWLKNGRRTLVEW